MSPEVLEQLRLASVGKTSTNLAELASQYLEHTSSQGSKNTLPARRSRITKFVATMQSAGIHDISGLNNSVVVIYFDQLDGKTSSVNATRRVVKSFITWVNEYKEMSVPVSAKSIKLVREGNRYPKYLEESEIAQVINSAKIRPDTRLLIQIGSQVGLRSSELANMRLSHIQGDKLYVLGKADIERYVTIPKSVQAAITEYVQRAPYRIDNDGYLFQTYWRGEWHQITSKSIWNLVKLAFADELNKNVSPHWLRHSYAVNLLLKGCDLVTIQKSLGHSDIRVTQIYLNLTDKEVGKRIHKYLA